MKSDILTLGHVGYLAVGHRITMLGGREFIVVEIVGPHTVRMMPVTWRLRLRFWLKAKREAIGESIQRRLDRQFRRRLRKRIRKDRTFFMRGFSPYVDKPPDPGCVVRNIREPH